MTSTHTPVIPAAITIAADNEYPHALPTYRWDAEQYMEGSLSKRRKMKLTEGQANEYTRIYFTQGQCHALAMALHELTDCVLMGSNWDHSRKTPQHVFVKLPQGLGLDICGLIVQGSHPDTFFRDDWQEMTLEGVQNLRGDDPRMDVARPYAKMLVDWYCR